MPKLPSSIKNTSSADFVSDSKISSPLHAHGFAPERIVEYFGQVCHTSNERVLHSIKDLLILAPHKEIVMIITSAGGPSGVGMSFYDTIRGVLKPQLVTIGSGDVDSSGVILFLSGETRFITKHSTMFLHLAGRTFENSKRFTAHDLEMIAKEDRIKDSQYADIVSDNSQGKLTQKDALSMMQEETLLTPQEIISYGLAHTILD